MAEREAEVLLQLDDGTLSEIRGKERVIVVKHVEVLIVSIVPTPEELEAARLQLHLPAGALSSDGRPLVFILIGEYKIPVCPTVPAIKEDPYTFVFAVPNLWLGLSFPPGSDLEAIEGFEMLVKTYGVLRAKPGANAQQQQPPQAQVAPAPAEQSRAVPAVAYGQPAYGSPAQVPYGSPAQAPYGSPVTGVVYDAQGQPVQGAVYDNGALVTQQAKPPLATRAVHGIGALTGLAVRGLRKGSQVVAGGLRKGSEKVMEHTTPCEQPVHVPEGVTSKVQAARTVTKSAVLVSGGLATAMVGVSAALGTGAVAVIGKIMPRSSNGSGITDSQAFQSVKQVGTAVVGGVATVVVEASDAARTILTSTCDGISNVVTHKFGGEVGQTTADTLGIVQDGVAVQQNLKNVGLKAVATNAARHAGNVLADDMTSPSQPSGAYPPPPAIADPNYAYQQQSAPPPQASYPVVEEPGVAPYQQYPNGYNSAYGAPQPQ